MQFFFHIWSQNSIFLFLELYITLLLETGFYKKYKTFFIFFKKLNFILHFKDTIFVIYTWILIEIFYKKNMF
jgi:hypothetical protein